MIKRRTFLSIAAAFCSGVSVAKAAQLDDPQQSTDAPSINVLTEAQWRRVDQSIERGLQYLISCLLYTSPSPRDLSTSRMPSSA